MPTTQVLNPTISMNGSQTWKGDRNKARLTGPPAVQKEISRAAIHVLAGSFPFVAEIAENCKSYR